MGNPMRPLTEDVTFRLVRSRRLTMPLPPIEGLNIAFASPDFPLRLRPSRDENSSPSARTANVLRARALARTSAQAAPADAAERACGMAAPERIESDGNRTSGLASRFLLQDGCLLGFGASGGPIRGNRGALAALPLPARAGDG